MGSAARPVDVRVEVAPALQGAVGGRRELYLGLPGGAGVGELLEALLTLYPRLRQHLAGDRPPTGGLYCHLAGQGDRFFLFSLSRPTPGGQASYGG